MVRYEIVIIGGGPAGLAAAVAAKAAGAKKIVILVAGLTALDCFGIVGMGIVSVKDGIVKQLRRDNVSRGVNVRFDENGDIVIELHIVVAYGVSIKAVTDNLMQSVKYKVEDFTSFKVSQINVFVEDVKVMD